jgi:hypothetical protein
MKGTRLLYIEWGHITVSVFDMCVLFVGNGYCTCTTLAETSAQTDLKVHNEHMHNTCPTLVETSAQTVLVVTRAQYLFKETRLLYIEWGHKTV